jgi:hypothetical protein
MGYASVLEAHIEVLQGLQKVSAYTEDMFNADEIDLQLTRQQERLLEEIVNKKFEDMQIGLDFIRPLIEKNIKLQLFIPGINEEIYEPGMIYGIFPPNYYHLVNNRSLVVTSSDASLCNDLTAYKNNTAVSQKVYTERICVLNFPAPTNPTAPFYYNVSLTLFSSAGNITKTLPAALNNLKSPNSWFSISNYILDNIQFPGVRIYWESYRDVYAPKSFIFVTTDPNITSVNISWPVSVGNPALAGDQTSGFTTTNYQVPNYLPANLTGYQQTQVANTLTETDEFYTQNLNAFYRSSKNNPKSQVSGDFLMAYEDKSFLISDLMVDYVRKPKHISLSLNQNFELAGDGPRIVVDRTVEFLKLAIENPTYQAVLNDNKVRNQV